MGEFSYQGVLAVTGTVLATGGTDNNVVNQYVADAIGVVLI
jgi:hypothetical protein